MRTLIILEDSGFHRYLKDKNLLKSYRSAQDVLKPVCAESSN